MRRTVQRGPGGDERPPRYFPLTEPQVRYKGPRRREEDPATFLPGMSFVEYQAAVDDLCHINNVTTEAKKIAMAKGLIHKTQGSAWRCASGPGSLCQEAKTLQDFLETLAVAVGYDAAGLMDGSPFIRFLRYTSLNFDQDMDVGHFLSVKRRLIKDFFNSLTRVGITSDEERIEIIT